MTVPANPHLGGRLLRAGAPLEEARRAAVLVHGRDQDAAVMLDVVGRLQLGDVAFLLPEAADRSWYPGRYFDPRPDLESHLAWSLEALERAIGTAEAADLGGERLVVAGFSQGACLVAELVAAGPRRLAGVAVLTGSLLGADSERPVPRVAPGLPMFFASSRHDSWIPFTDVRGTARAFADAGAHVRLVELDDREHHISDAAVDGLRALLAGGA